MKRVGELLRFPERTSARASGVTIVVPGSNGQAPLYLTEEEAGAVGLRQATNPHTGQRVHQFGLCRDAQGEWVYPEFRTQGEYAHELIERTGRDRARRERCAKASTGAVVSLFDEP